MNAYLKILFISENQEDFVAVKEMLGDIQSLNSAISLFLSGSIQDAVRKMSSESFNLVLLDDQLQDICSLLQFSSLTCLPFL